MYYYLFIVFVSILPSYIHSKPVVSPSSCVLTSVVLQTNGYSHQYIIQSECPLHYEEVPLPDVHQTKIFIKCPIKDEATKQMIETMNSQAETSFYSIKFNPHKDGVECVVNLNPNNLNPTKSPLELQKTTSITGKHALVIKVHDPNALKVMQANSNDKRIKRLAYAEPKKTIALDFGHGGKDPGYTDKKGIQEKTINKLIGDKVADLLKKKIITSV